MARATIAKSKRAGKKPKSWEVWTPAYVIRLLKGGSGSGNFMTKDRIVPGTRAANGPLRRCRLTLDPRPARKVRK